MFSKFSSLLTFPFSILSSNVNKNEKFISPKLSEFINTNSHIQAIKHFSGTITSLNQDEGVVNNNIYFTIQSNCLQNLKLGDNVHGKAVRDDKNSAWRASEIYLKNELWEDSQNILQDSCLEGKQVLFENEFPTKFIGKVVSIHNRLICLNSQLSFYTDDHNCSFQICQGDWIQCKREKSSTDSTSEDRKCIITEVIPLRRKLIHGIITFIQPSYFVLNGEVFCYKSTCIFPAKPSLRVVAEVIESDQLNYSWRAIRIWPDESAKIDISQHTLDLFSQVKGVDSREDKCTKKNEPCKTEQKCTNEKISIKGSFSINLKGVGFSDYLKITLKNECKGFVWLLESISFHSEHSIASQLSFDFTLPFPIRLEPLLETPLVFHCIGKYIGLSEEMIIFNFDTGYVINTIIKVNVENYNREPQFHGSLVDPMKGRIIRGEKPVHASPFMPIKLPQAIVPSRIWDAIVNKENLIDVMPVLQNPLNLKNYVERFSTLLFLEEIESNLQMRKFDIPCTSFSRIGDYLALTVEGLAESRPSLMVGDSVVASSPSGVCEDVKFEGIIHKVLKSQVLLKFHPSFHSNYNEEDYSVQLFINRTSLRRCHLAASFVLRQLGPSVLFPSKLFYQLPQVVFLEDDFRLDQNNNNDRSDNDCNVNELDLMKRGSCRTKFINKGSNHVIAIRDQDLQSIEESSSNLMRKLDWYPFKIDKKGYCMPVLQMMAKKRFELKTRNFKWFNKALNSEQRVAVKRILEGSTRPLPYIIFGPPGTGKTVTLVETILQIYSKVPFSRILVVSPSNSASDLVAVRAIESGDLKPGELVRINAFNRSLQSIPEKLEAYCTKGNDLKEALQHRIVVSTSTTSGLFYTVKLRNGHFTHVFIDEAGQLTEPETCISLGLVNSSCGQIVLAGDPKQLGPVVLSSFARKYGLNQSLLHRLCSSVIYQPVDPVLKLMYSSDIGSTGSEDTILHTRNYRCYYEPTLVTLLVRNYRSHPDLIKVPSSLFYHSLLVPSNDKFNNLFMDWKELPNPKCPLIFHGIKGENLQEADSPSWFNPSEAYQVSRYVISLLEYGLTPNDIGVITPYKKQVNKIRKLLNSFGVEQGIKVGPVEEFQGQERLAIILSTVRSFENMINTDILHNLGFVRCEQRFNVAITRAIGILIVIGNPVLLGQDPNWNAFLTYCISKGTVKN